jgi:hypothetical protein
VLGVGAQERRLVDPERSDLSHTVGVVDEGCPAVADRRHHHRPSDAQPVGEQGHRAGLLTDGTGAFPPGASREHVAIGEFLGPFALGPLGTVQLRTGKAALGPDELRVLVEYRQVTHDDPLVVLGPRDHAAGRTFCCNADRLDPDQQFLAVLEDRRTRKPGSPKNCVGELVIVTRGRSLLFSRCWNTTRMARPLVAPAGTYRGTVM